MKQLPITIAAVVLVGCGNSEANQALLDAAKFGNIKAAKAAIADGADVNAIVDDWTPLHNAAEYGQTTIAELLIEKGANVNTRYVDGETPLDVAIHPEISNKTDEIADLLRKHAARRVKN